MEGEVFQAWMNQTACHKYENGMFARKVVGEEVKRKIICIALTVFKQGIRFCAKNTRGTVERHLT
eukprot:CAMPEP_0194320676 /NCGR_PEP_ID=MMETSP0171-20130528/16949_1 /TAXON_ID=218684 /ORGANISM="Corethron pennatum, Strain L29A3" /LENGTH=64 /DNA_ID=CAMNT_0039078265 /DNA_START=55 /DNA_END=249 /DNA_ORIENTATION=-